MTEQTKNKFITDIELEVEQTDKGITYTLRKYNDKLIIKENEIIYIKNGILQLHKQFASDGDRKLEDILLTIKTFFDKLLPDTRIKEIGDDIMNQLAEKYILVNPEEIKLFLAYNPDLINTLLESYENIRKIVGDYPIHLEFYWDYEYPNWQELLIVIKTKQSDEIDELEEKLSEEWYNKLPSEITTRLGYKIEE